MPVSHADVGAPQVGDARKAAELRTPAEPPLWYDRDIGEVLVSEEEIAARIDELAARSTPTTPGARAAAGRACSRAPSW